MGIRLVRTDTSAPQKFTFGHWHFQGLLTNRHTMEAKR